MIQILVFGKEFEKRRFELQFEVGTKAIENWKFHGETDEQFVKRLIVAGLDKISEDRSQ